MLAVSSSFYVNSKASHYLRCSRTLVTKDKSKSVYDGDNVGKSDVKTEHLKRTKRCDKRVKGTRDMLSKKKIHQIKKKVRDDKNNPHKNPHHRRTVSGRAVDVSQCCKMAIIQMTIVGIFTSQANLSTHFMPNLMIKPRFLVRRICSPSTFDWYVRACPAILFNHIDTISSLRIYILQLC